MKYLFFSEYWMRTSHNYSKKRVLLKIGTWFTFTVTLIILTALSMFILGTFFVKPILKERGPGAPYIPEEFPYGTNAVSINVIFLKH